MSKAKNIMDRSEDDWTRSSAYRVASLFDFLNDLC